MLPLIGSRLFWKEFFSSHSFPSLDKLVFAWKLKCKPYETPKSNRPSPNLLFSTLITHISAHRPKNEFCKNLIQHKNISVFFYEFFIKLYNFPSTRHEYFHFILFPFFFCFLDFSSVFINKWDTIYFYLVKWEWLGFRKQETKKANKINGTK